MLDQIVTKLRRAIQRAQRQRSLPPSTEAAIEAIEALLQSELKSLPHHLRQLEPEAARAWLRARPDLPKLMLDLMASLRRVGDGMVISEHPDELVGVETGYGDAQKPEDYLEAFGTFVKAQQNEVAALKVVCTRPPDPTRVQLKELKLLLAAQNLTEPALRKAWSELRNEDIAASIIGFIRQQALGAPPPPVFDPLFARMTGCETPRPSSTFPRRCSSGRGISRLSFPGRRWRRSARSSKACYRPFATELTSWSR